MKHTPSQPRGWPTWFDNADITAQAALVNTLAGITLICSGLATIWMNDPRPVVIVISTLLILPSAVFTVHHSRMLYRAWLTHQQPRQQLSESSTTSFEFIQRMHEAGY